MKATLASKDVYHRWVHYLCQRALRRHNPRFAYDAYRRFIQIYSATAKGLSKQPMEDMLHDMKHQIGVKNDPDIPAEKLKELCDQFKAFYKLNKKEDFPQDPWKQLWGAIMAVFNSWEAEKAQTYRRVEKITDLKGTAVNVVQMVFGNKGENSGTGVCFTRDPNTGENTFYGDYLINAQGEDVVAGIRTPQEITLEGSHRWATLQNVSEEVRAAKFPSLEESMPVAYAELMEIQQKLENHYQPRRLVMV